MGATCVLPSVASLTGRAVDVYPDLKMFRRACNNIATRTNQSETCQTRIHYLVQ